MFMQLQCNSFHILTRGKYCNRNTPNPNTSLSSLPVGSKSYKKLPTFGHLLQRGAVEGVLLYGHVGGGHVVSLLQHRTEWWGPHVKRFTYTGRFDFDPASMGPLMGGGGGGVPIVACRCLRHGIAPVLVANCPQCHMANLRKGDVPCHCNF